MSLAQRLGTRPTRPAPDYLGVVGDLRRQLQAAEARRSPARRLLLWLASGLTALR